MPQHEELFEGRSQIWATLWPWQIPYTPQTRFEIASLSKQLTAAAILELADSGKLNVEDPVDKYYPENPASWKCWVSDHRAWQEGP